MQVSYHSLISVFCRVVFGRYHETSALASASKYGLNNVNELLLVFHGPIYLVVITSAEIDHDVLVSIEEHDRAWVVELVHLVEIGHFGDVDKIDSGKVFHLLCNLV